MTASAPVTSAGLAPPVTLCVVFYGAHSDLAERFLSSLYACTDSSRFDLRAGLNEVEPATQRLVAEYARRFGNIELFVEPINIFKNPLMRRMFRERPLTTRWTLWCDDDTHFTQKDWLQRLDRRMRKYPKVAMWGDPYYLETQKPEILDWIRNATWYRSVPFIRGTRADLTDTFRFVFVTGGFWALRTDAIDCLDWPDPRLIHAGEDFLLSEALRQNGFEIGEFSEGVRINDAPRRNAQAPQVREFPR